MSIKQKLEKMLVDGRWEMISDSQEVDSTWMSSAGDQVIDLIFNADATGITEVVISDMPVHPADAEMFLHVTMEMCK